MRKPTRVSRVKQQRPRSRTLKEVHAATLDDLVFPSVSPSLLSLLSPSFSIGGVLAVERGNMRRRA